LSVEINSSVPHDLGPKGFYPRRDKSGLKVITQTLIIRGASKGALPGVAGRIKKIFLF
jgi:hypothetical protein